MKAITKCQVRWMIRRDIPEVLDIENESFDFAWSEEDFLNVLRQRNCIGMAAELNGRVIGFMIYELFKTKLRVMSFAVTRRHRRSGVGSQMADKLIAKLAQQRRKTITLEVRESNLAAQLFWRSQGFKAVSVLKDFYEDTSEDAYLMEYVLKGASDADRCER